MGNQLNPGVYYILNLINHKIYIGQSKNINIRLNRHRAKLRSNSHNSSRLQAEWNIYGEHAFEFGVLVTTSHWYQEPEKIERIFFNVYQSFDPEFGYNSEYSIISYNQKLGDSANSHMCADRPMRPLKHSISGPGNRKGENHNHAVLTEAQVLDIRKQYAERGVGKLELAEKYGVTVGAIHSIIHRYSWRHI